tara:strand:- start:363 stop:596 length:234 start_codon:yes stop_codon:yes gene_type:complete
MNKIKNNRPDKKSRELEKARIQNLLDSDYYFSGSQSWSKGHSTYSGMSKRSSFLNRNNAYSRKLDNFVQKRINIQNQ